MRGWPVAAGLSGVLRELAKLENSLDVLVASALTLAATGPLAIRWTVSLFCTDETADEAAKMC